LKDIKGGRNQSEKLFRKQMGDAKGCHEVNKEVRTYYRIREDNKKGSAKLTMSGG